MAVRLILIAAKQLNFAKSRLAVAVAADERAMLAECMFRDVLSAALESRRTQHVAVVTSDRRLLEISRRAGAIAIDEEFPQGLNAAVRIATAALCAEGATTICTVLSDIPLVRGEDIDEVFAAGERHRVVLVPSRDSTGTNILLRSPGDVIPTRFGSHSLARHRVECLQANASFVTLALARPAIDLDTPDDLREFMASPGATHTFNTYNQMARLGLVNG